MILDHTTGQRGPSGILEAQIEARNANSASRLKLEERIRWVAAELDRVHPGTNDYLKGESLFPG